MRITLKELRNIVNEEMFSNWMNTAGWCAQGSNIGRSRKGTEPPPPGLGDDSDDEEQKNQDQHPQEKSQVGARYNDRHSLAP